MSKRKQEEILKKLYIEPKLEDIPELNTKKRNTIKEFIEKYTINPDLDKIPQFSGENPGRIFSFRDFTGGLNTDKSQNNLNRNELEKADNVDYTKYGGLQKRPDVNNVYGSFGQQVEKIFEWTKSSGQEELMAVLANGDLITVDDNTTRFNLLGTNIDFVVFKEYMYFIDGNNYYRMDDLTFNWEVVPEKDTSKVEEKTVKIECNYGVATEISLPDDDFSIVEDSEEVYTYDQPDESWTKDTDYTIDYTNNQITFLSSGGTTEGNFYGITFEYLIPSDNNLSPIKKCKYIIRHSKSQRVFAAGDTSNPSTLYYSEPLEPDYFKGYSVLEPTTNDGAIQGLAILNDMLLVFYPESIWAWRGIDPERDAVWEKLPVKQGLTNHNTIEIGYNNLTFTNNSGIYILNSSKGLTSLTKQKVNNIIKDIGNRNTITSSYYSKDNQLMLAYSETGGRNDKILVFNWDIGAFSVWTDLGDINDLYQTKGGDLLIASDNYIKQLSDTYGSNVIPLRIKFKNSILKEPYYYKIIHYMFLSIDEVTGSTVATINIDQTTQNFNITSPISRKRLYERGIEIQMELQDISKSNLIVYDVGLEFRVANTYRGELNGNS